MPRTSQGSVKCLAPRQMDDYKKGLPHLKVAPCFVQPTSKGMGVTTSLHHSALDICTLGSLCVHPVPGLSLFLCFLLVFASACMLSRMCRDWLPDTQPCCWNPTHLLGPGTSSNLVVGKYHGSNLTEGGDYAGGKLSAQSAMIVILNGASIASWMLTSSQ